MIEITKATKQAIKLNTIYHADCVVLMEYMDADFVDLTVTSPPYDELRNYNGYHFNFESIAKGLFKVTKKGGVVVWVVGDKIRNVAKNAPLLSSTMSFQSIGFNVHDIIEATSDMDNLEYYAYSPSLKRRGLTISRKLESVNLINKNSLSDLFLHSNNRNFFHKRVIFF